MFLTNNHNTINNLMIYSKGKYIYKIIPKIYYNTKRTPYYWVNDLQNNSWKKYLNTKAPNMHIDGTLLPYGNINKRMRLQSDNNGEIIVVNNRGGKCF